MTMMVDRETGRSRSSNGRFINRIKAHVSRRRVGTQYWVGTRSDRDPAELEPTIQLQLDGASKTVELSPELAQALFNEPSEVESRWREVQPPKSAESTEPPHGMFRRAWDALRGVPSFWHGAWFGAVLVVSGLLVIF